MTIQNAHPLITTALAFVADSPHTQFESNCIQQTLTDWQADDELIVCGILYPALSQDIALLEKAEKYFDKGIVKIIKAALQMNIVHEAKREQVEALRKMMLAMVDDIRVVLLKLAERLFLVTTLENKSAEYQQKIAQQTLDYYAPLANRLGMGALKWQLEDGAFRYLHPDQFKKIASAFALRKEERERNIHEMIDHLKILLEKHGIRHAQFSGRVKHFYSIYKKIHRKNINVDHIYDTSAIRVIVPSIEECYAVLSLVHERWQPIPEEFDDYIAKPKLNGYQSIHTAVLRKDQTPIEIQIRTKPMHDAAEKGIAAHWKYKENAPVKNKESEKIHLLRELLDWQNTLSKKTDSAALYRDAFHDRVYVFSPEGEVFDLPQGATPLDFAYLVHTDIGHRCRGAKVNNVLVPLTTILKTGDHIDILTNKEAHPSHDWIRTELGFLKTTHAIRKVKSWYRKLDFEKNLTEGQLQWEKIAKQYHFQEADLQKLIEGFNLQKTDTLLAALGSGDIHASAIIQKLTTNKKTPDEIILSTEKLLSSKNGQGDFSIYGVKNLLTQLAQCCHPIPGDDIVGYITKNRGISIHQKNCSNIAFIASEHPERIMDIAWEDNKEQPYLISLHMQAEDRTHLLRDITGLISQLSLSIASIQSHTNTKTNTAYIALTIQMNNAVSLEDILKKMRQIEGVIQVSR